jgi:hypothetical protein
VSHSVKASPTLSWCNQWRRYQIEATRYNVLGFYTIALGILADLFLSSTDKIDWPFLFGGMVLVYAPAILWQRTRWHQITYIVALYAIAILPLAWAGSHFIQYPQLEPGIVFSLTSGILLTGLQVYRFSSLVVKHHVRLLDQWRDANQITPEERDRLVQILLRASGLHSSSF